MIGGPAMVGLREEQRQERRRPTRQVFDDAKKYWTEPLRHHRQDAGAENPYQIWQGARRA